MRQALNEQISNEGLPRYIWVLQALATLLLVVIPEFGLAAFIILALVRRKTKVSRLWSTIAVAFLLLALVRLAIHDFDGWWWNAGTGLVVFVAGTVLHASRSAVVVGLLAVLSLASLAGIALFTNSANQWIAASGEFATFPFTGWLNRSVVTARSNNEAAVKRSWLLEGGFEGAASFSVRLQKGVSGWSWKTQTQGWNLKPSEELGEVATRFIPQGDNPFIFRSAVTDEPIAGRLFKGSAELRTTESHRTCGTVYLAETGARLFHAEPICVGEHWETVEVIWEPPLTASSNVLDIVLNDFHETSLEVKAVEILEWAGGRWVSLGSLAPTGVAASIHWLDNDGIANVLTQRRLNPSADYQLLTLPIVTPASNKPSILEVALFVEKDLTVAIGPIKLSRISDDISPPLPIRPVQRFQLWFYDFNLAGHAIAVSGLALLLFAHRIQLRITGVGLAAAVILLTGSRLALAALLFSVLWNTLLLFLHQPRRWLFWASMLVLGLGLGIIVYTVYPETRFLKFDAAGGVPRTHIWIAAWEALRTNPIRGIGLDGFKDYWISGGFSQGRQLVQHAHNFVLSLSASFGIPGMITALITLSLLAAKAWSNARVRGMIFIASILILQIADFTLLHASVLFVTILALNIQPDKLSCRITSSDTTAILGPASRRDSR